MPFVPALFKALADDPEALLAAWLQARALYDDPAAAEAARVFRTRACPTLSFDPTPELREAVQPFVEELPFMLLIASSLSLTLDGRLARRTPPEPELPPAGPVPAPEFSDRGEHALFVEICRVYGTQHLPSVYRMLATRGLLEDAWQAIGPVPGERRGPCARRSGHGRCRARRDGIPGVRVLRCRTRSPGRRPASPGATAESRLRARGIRIVRTSRGLISGPSPMPSRLRLMPPSARRRTLRRGALALGFLDVALEGVHRLLREPGRVELEVLERLDRVELVSRAGSSRGRLR